MAGRPKGSVKENRKKLKTYRLSEDEARGVKNLLDILRNKKGEAPNRLDYTFFTQKVFYDFKNCRTSDDFDNNKKLTEVYVICIIEENKPYIIKCPVIDETPLTYKIKVKDRSRFYQDYEPCYTVNDLYRDYTVNKKKSYINKETNFIIRRVYDTYELAFINLLRHNKYNIMSEILALNDMNIYKLFIDLCGTDYFTALEYMAKYLNMDYVFRLDDDTV